MTTTCPSNQEKMGFSTHEQSEDFFSGPKLFLQINKEGQLISREKGEDGVYRERAVGNKINSLSVVDVRHSSITKGPNTYHKIEFVLQVENVGECILGLFANSFTTRNLFFQAVGVGREELLDLLVAKKGAAFCYSGTTTKVPMSVSSSELPHVKYIEHMKSYDFDETIALMRAHLEKRGNGNVTPPVQEKMHPPLEANPPVSDGAPILPPSDVEDIFSKDDNIPW